MLQVKNDSILPIPTDELIADVEKYYRIIFPKEYIDFIKKYNGAKPITDTFIVDKHEYVIERFMCLLGDLVDDYEEGWADIEVIITEIGARLSDDGNRIGKKLIPIAALFAGDYVCLDFRNSEEEPEVCIWYHEESEDFAPKTRKIANNFNEFLDML